MKKRITLLLAALLVITSFVSCASKNASRDEAFYEVTESVIAGNGSYVADMDFGYSANDDYAPEIEMQKGEMVDSGAALTDNRKIVREMSLRLETKTFDAAIEKIQSSVKEAGGYIESSYVSGSSINNTGSPRSASFTLRVPASALDVYVEGLGNMFNILSKNENAKDITDTYFDTASRLKSLQTQEERLLSMLEGANELEYMLRIEETLQNVRYQIETVYSALQRYDSMVSMSTLTIDLREVVEYKVNSALPKTFGERVSIAFEESWDDFADNCRDFAVEFVYAVPTLIVLVVIFGAIGWIIGASVKRSRKKKAAQYRYVPVAPEEPAAPADPAKNHTEQ